MVKGSELDERAFQEKIRSQVELIRTNVPDVGIFPGNWEAAGVEYLYRRGHLLVRDEDAPRVAEVVPGRVAPLRSSREGVRQGDSRGGGAIGAETARAGLSRFQLADDEDGVPAAVQRVDEALGAGVATPDHLLHLVSVASHCPATEPDAVHTDAVPVPAPRGGCGGEGVLVHILDSGWIPGADQHSWLAGVDGDTEDTYFQGGPQAGEIMPYSGHGTFCAGVLRTVAPGAEVYVEKSFFGAGGVFESDIVAQVSRGLALGVDIFSLSAGCYSRQDIPLLGFDVIQNLISRHKGVVLVAAAGNDDTRRPFWPAASPSTVSVGALDAAGTGRAWYTNHGGWVDVYAPGTDLVNAFATGTFTYVEPPRTGDQAQFAGMARWSGTSFATPLVAGLIAERMHQTGENGRTAAAELLRRARQLAIPGVGAVLRS